MNKFADIIIVIVLILVYVYVFSRKGPYVTSGHLTGIVSSSATVSGIRFSSDTVKRSAESNLPMAGLPEFNVYSDNPLPERFVVNTVGVKSLADYIILTEKQLQNKLLTMNPQSKSSFNPGIIMPVKSSTGTISTPVREKKRVKIGKKTGKDDNTSGFINSIVNAVTGKKETKEETETPSTYPGVAGYVLNSNRSYIYPSLTTGGDVILTVLSSTPYKDSTIIRYRIDNQSKSYYFTETTQLLTGIGEPVVMQKFGDDYVSPEKSETGYIIAKPGTKNIILRLTSGGTVKCLEIKFSLP